MELFPFEQKRPVQKDMIGDVDKALKNKSHLVAHAPTGLGKTSAALSPALSYAIKNKKDVIFLTPKHTQHQIVVDTLKKIRERYNIEVNVVDFIGKKWMCAMPGVQGLGSGEFAEYCKTMVKEGRCQFYKKVRKNGGEISDKGLEIMGQLKEKSPLHVEEVKEHCSIEEACPYEVSTELGKSANVIIADYYHLFHPNIRKYFLSKIKKDLGECIVIVDEAQILPGRIRNVLSSSISNFSINRAIKEAQTFDYEEIAESLEYLHNILIDFKEERLEVNKESLMKKEELIKKIEDILGVNFEEFTASLLLAGEKIRAENRASYIGSLGSFLETWNQEGIEYARILKKSKWKDKEVIQIKFICLDPSVSSKILFEECHSAILMSGTLIPTSMYRDVLGMEEKRTKCEEYDNPFPKENKLSMIVPDTTTKYTRRGDVEFGKIAKWCADMANSIQGNVAIFFPSYYLKDQISKFFERLSRKSIFHERRGLSKSERADILGLFKNYSGMGAVFLGVTGGSFSEGIDLPGNLLNGVIVVGIPLDSPDMETKSLIEYYDEKYKAGWDYGYIFPAMNRVVQACGRAIRTETDKGVIVMLDERFTWRNYFKCLPSDWKIIVTKEPIKRIENFYKKEQDQT